MATFRLPILGALTSPDTSGGAFFEPAAVNFGSNALYPHMLLVYSDSGATAGVGGVFEVPQNFAQAGTTQLVLETASTATGDVDWEFDYSAIGATGPLDPSADTESLTSSGNLISTVRAGHPITIALTSANFSAGDQVLFGLRRQSGNDTLAASAYVFGADFQYDDR